MLLTEEVNVKITPNTYKYYKTLGYEFEHTYDIITVKIEDLPKGSYAIVNVLCDYCNDEICYVTYNDYNRRTKLNGKYACANCISKKTKENNMIKYGIDSTSKLKYVKSKIKQTCLDRYGVDNYSKTDECKKKYANTCLEKYGVKNASQNTEIKEKIYNTNIQRYGTNTPSKNNLIKKKAEKTCMERFETKSPTQNKDIKELAKRTLFKHYGVKNPGQSPEIREKVTQSLYKNSSQKISSQQLYLHNLYGGKLNYPISQYNADICFPEENITIEYNGGGHMLNIITGRETQEEHNRKEIIRNNIIKRAGFKQIIITSSKDFLPSDKILLKMLEQAKQYFNTTNHTWIEYNIDTSLMRNAENKEGVFFDFGKLRKIKKAS